LADHSTISRSSVKARKAGAGDVGDCMAHSAQRRKEKAKQGRGCFMRSLVSISGALGACIDGMAVVSGK